MFRKINTKLLVGIFAGLLILVVATELIDSKKGNRTFKSELINVNADEVTSIEINAKANNKELITLFKENDLWKVKSGDKTYNADASIARRLVSELNNMKTKSVAATSKDRWENFEVTDSLGTGVKIFAGTEKVADLIVGKFSFSQPRNMTSYVRLTGEKEVYGVEGMLGMSFNRKTDSFRDRAIIKSNKTDWNKLSFDYPADSSFVLTKTDKTWMAGELQTDSAKVANYFSQISMLSDGNFVGKPQITPTHRLTIEGNNQMQKIEINGYKISPDEFILESSQNPGAYFNSKTSAEKLFISIMKLIDLQE